MIKSILIPTDFSDNAGDALRYTLKFIGDRSVRLHIVHIINVDAVQPEMKIDGLRLKEEYIARAVQKMSVLEGLGQQYLSQHTDADFTLTTKVLIGPTAKSIKHEAKYIQADMIIMGTQGKHHTEVEKALGTVSTAVINQAPCPVLLIPRNYVYEPLGKVLFATNLDHHNPYELWRSLDLLSPHSVHIHCLHVAQEGQASDAVVADFGAYMIEHAPKAQTIFRSITAEDVEMSIADYSTREQTQLIVMTRSKKSWWNQLMQGRHTKRMIQWLDQPLLVLNEVG